MPALNPLITQRLVDVSRQAEAAGHGARGEVYRAAAAELGVSLPTLHRYLKQVRFQVPRKRRADAGVVALSRDDAVTISGALMESTRRNGKRLGSVESLVPELRANGLIEAGRMDPETGEFTPLSNSAIHRALRVYGLHPEQLNRPTPKQQLRSLYPNHIWQIDPSLCVLYYLPKEEGLRCMPNDVFYKNKIDNIAKITHARVWRYVITDHTSGAFYVEYVLGAESGQNLSQCFINAMQKRHPSDPFHGRPSMVMLDPGSANTGAVFRNLCAALGVELLINKPGQPWAKGQVEKTNDIVEREFEHGLRFVNVDSLDQLNDYCWRWMRNHNSTRIHTRTRRTRYAVWQTIQPGQLITVPPAEVLRELAYQTPIERTVTPFLQVGFLGKTWDVSTVPGVEVGEKILITRNAFRDDAAQVVIFDQDGRQMFHMVEAIVEDGYGFNIDAPVAGENYKRHKKSRAEQHQEEIELRLMTAATPEEAAAKRKGKQLPFDGKFQPYKEVDDTPLPTYLPKRGTALDLQSPVFEVPPLSVLEVARRLKPLLGPLWNAEAYAWVQKHYPEGAREDELPAIEQTIRTMHAPATGLRVVGGE